MNMSSKFTVSAGAPLQLFRLVTKKGNHTGNCPKGFEACECNPFSPSPIDPRVTVEKVHNSRTHSETISYGKVATSSETQWHETSLLAGQWKNVPNQLMTTNSAIKINYFLVSCTNSSAAHFTAAN